MANLNLTTLSNLELRAHQAERLRKRALHHREIALDGKTDRVGRETHTEMAEWLEAEAQRLYSENISPSQRTTSRYPA